MMRAGTNPALFERSRRHFSSVDRIQKIPKIMEMLSMIGGRSEGAFVGRTVVSFSGGNIGRYKEKRTFRFQENNERRFSLGNSQVFHYLQRERPQRPLGNGAPMGNQGGSQGIRNDLRDNTEDIGSPWISQHVLDVPLPLSPLQETKWRDIWDILRHVASR